MKNVIIGAGGMASETRSMVFTRWTSPYFWTGDSDIDGCVIDQKYGKQGDWINNMWVLGDIEWLREQVDIATLCAIGDPCARYEIINRLGFSQHDFFSMQHPTARVELHTGSYGSIFSAYSYVAPTAQLDNHIILNVHSSVHHDSVIHDFCTLSPGARVAGNCWLGEGVFMGMNSCVIENVSIGSWAKIGAGAVVLEDVPAGAVVVGVPGKVIKYEYPEWMAEAERT